VTAVMITGSRDWTDDVVIFNALSPYGDGDVIILGDARGADAIARGVCAERGLQFTVFEARWVEYGWRAGHERNSRMASALSRQWLRGHKMLCLGFPLEKSRGTWDALRQARSARAECRYYDVKSGTWKEFR